MTLTIIGHFCLDLIHHADENEVRSYGGIFFSIAAAANVLAATDRVRPVFGVGRAEYDELIERLSTYSNVDTSGVFKTPGPTNQVHLMYGDDTRRVECSRHIADPVPWKRIKSALDTDMVLINMISGFDVTLETLDEIRMAIRDEHIPIAMDVHSLTLGIREDGTRYHRPVTDWRRWLFMLDAVQMNDEEAAILSAERPDEATLARHILSLNTKACIVTKGSKGCTVYVDDRKRFLQHDIEPVAETRAVDPTGCGDVFAATYCSSYMKTRDILKSAAFANLVAARKVEIPGSVGIDKLSEFRMTQACIGENTP